MAKILAPLQDEPPMIPAVQPATISASKVVTKSREDIKQAEIMRAWIAPSKAHEDRVPMAMLNGILNAGMSSRLFQTFREGEKGLCYQVYTKHEANEEGGTFKFYIGTDPDNITLVRQLFQAEVDKLMTTLPSAEEMKRVRLLMKSNILADTQKSADVSNHLVAHRSGKHLSNLELAAALESVTPQQVQEVARKYLSKPSISAILAPKSALSAHGLPVDGEVEGA
jgi:predicted Zn-dependent peptidase